MIAIILLLSKFGTNLSYEIKQNMFILFYFNPSGKM